MSENVNELNYIQLSRNEKQNQTDLTRLYSPFKVIEEEIPSTRGVINHKNYRIQVSIKPRVAREKYTVEETVIKKKWDFNKSIFKDWKKDSEKLLDKCFKFDWENTRIEGLVKDPEQIKEL